MNVLLPRLPAPACETLVKGFLDQGPEAWGGFDPEVLPETVSFAATGGTPLPTAELKRLREELEKLARMHGFGGNSDRNSFASFDTDAAAWLAQSELFSTGEALRDDVWSFVSAVVAPDIVHWRFGEAFERYIGGIRNTFQRLWMRGRVLDRGADHPERWKLLTELTEDALVQITERPSIGGDSILALAVGEAWFRAAQIHGRARMEAIMRKAILTIRIRNEVKSLSDLPSDSLVGFLDRVFEVSSITRSERDPTSRQVSSRQERNSSLPEAISAIRAESERHGWLSPKSRAALHALMTGESITSRSERNALDYLLSKLAGAGLLADEVETVRSFVGVGSRSSSEAAKPKNRSWAIWRAR